jgi:cell division protein FtsN
MARDFKHRHRYHSKKTFQRRSQLPESQAETKGSSLNIWLGVIVLSLGLVGSYYVFQHFAQKVNQVSVAEEVNSDSKETTEKSASVMVKAMSVDTPNEVKKSPIEFSFYEGLAESEVVVDAVPLSTTLERPHYIQAGTFGSRKIALQEQQRLAKMGQELDLTVFKGSKRDYYRLRIGPYTDRLEMNKKRNELRRLGVDTLLIKAR